MILIGCHSGSPIPRTAADETMFGPSTMRIHPTFTQVKDLTDKGAPDGIEAVLELQDQFSEPTRASGRVMFELYSYRTQSPDPRGARLANWAFALDTRTQQIARWSAPVRGYTFKLPFPGIDPNRAYVLTAQFDLKGTRLFDRLIVEPAEGARLERRTQRARGESPGRT